MPEDAEVNFVGRGDAQIGQILVNIKRALGAGAGGMSDICKIAIFLVRLDEKVFEAVPRLRGELLGTAFPASTLIQVPRLASPDWLTEIEAEAMI